MKKTCALLVTCLGLVGCALFPPEGLPEDPLFLSRKPFEAPAKKAPPARTAFQPPTIPANPLQETHDPTILVHRKKTPPPEAPASKTPGILTNRSQEIPPLSDQPE